MVSGAKQAVSYWSGNSVGLSTYKRKLVCMYLRMSCAQHNQHVKHAVGRGSDGIPLRKLRILAICTEIEFEDDFLTI